MSDWYSSIRPFLFHLEAERAHALSLIALDWAPSFCFQPTQGKPVKAFGLDFAHPVGLAAGLDKNGEHLDGLAKLGFSFIEVGTVTPKPQVGNPKPRLFRIPSAQAIINRMGFNNLGVDALVNNVKKSRYKGILGINIGKNKDTPIDKASEDYLHCFRKVYEHASYVTINISSPNTPELRQLQQGHYLADLLSVLQQEQQKLQDQFQRHVPLLLKVSPDENQETLKEMAEIIIRNNIEGIIATNTTCSREAVKDLPHADEVGGLSGRPVRDLSLNCLRFFKEYLGNTVTVIGVGGIDSVESAQEKLKAGASLIQVYTGLIYQGPNLIPELVNGLSKK